MEIAATNDVFCRSITRVCGLIVREKLNRRFETLFFGDLTRLIREMMVNEKVKFVGKII
jgi:hypothetical protein